MINFWEEKLIKMDFSSEMRVVFFLLYLLSGMRKKMFLYSIEIHKPTFEFCSSYNMQKYLLVISLTQWDYLSKQSYQN